MTESKGKIMRIGAICLAAGRGTRMESKVQKQYLLLQGKPVLYYSLKALEESRVDDVVLVVPSGEEEYCQREIVERFGFSKVSKIIAGGAERYHSVIKGLSAVTKVDYVLIHDGARPFLSNDIIERSIEGAEKSSACVVGMPVKDTIKIADADGNIEITPDRTRVWQIQTPQAFKYSLIKKAYSLLEKQENAGETSGLSITDDAMVVEHFMNYKVKLVKGSYQNIKITTPEDMMIAEAFLGIKQN